MKKMSVKTAILIPSLVALVIGIIIIVSVTGTMSANTVTDLTHDLMDTIVDKTAAEFQSVVNTAYGPGLKTSSIVSRFMDGDYTQNIPVRCETDITNIAINRILEQTNQTMGEIRSSVGQVSSNAKQVSEIASSIAESSTYLSEGAQSLAEGSTRQNVSIENLSGLINEIAEKSKSNSDTTDLAAKLADAIIDKAKKDNRQMNEMVTAVNDIPKPA
jgi:methyl-accepting chemotaxis protein